VTQQDSATNLRNFRTFLLMRQFQQREIGERITLAMKEAGGMTQEELADLLNVSKRSVQDYVAGTTVPWKHFQLLEEIFKKPLSWFLHGEATADDDRLGEVLAALAGLQGQVGEVLALLQQLQVKPAPRRAKR
jgi:transcriptional regulator with XRE-family HTH domain